MSRVQLGLPALEGAQRLTCFPPLRDNSASILEGLRNLPFAPSAQMHPVGLDLPLAEDGGADDSGDESDLDVRLSERIRSTARAQAAYTSAGYASVGAAHLEAQYASEDEDPDSVARRKRRLGQSYISSESRRRTEAIRERRLRLAEMMAAEEDACVAAAADEDEMDVDGPGRRSGGAGGEPHPPRKRRFFRESRLDLAALLKPPARTSAASGPFGYGMMDPRRAGPAGGAAGYAASDLASMSHVGAGALSNGGNGITREWQDGLPA